MVKTRFIISDFSLIWASVDVTTKVMWAILKSKQGFKPKRFYKRKVRNGTLKGQETTIIIFKCQFCADSFYHRANRDQHAQLVNLKEKGSYRLHSKALSRRYRICGPNSRDYGDNRTLKYHLRDT